MTTGSSTSPARPRRPRRPRRPPSPTTAALAGVAVYGLLTWRRTRWWFYYWAFDGAALSTDSRTALARRDYVPFHRFTLRPGETRYVRLDFHTATCDPAGLQSGFSRIRSLPLRYRTLGVTRTATVPLHEVTIAIQTIGKCDHPLPNRP